MPWCFLKARLGGFVAGPDAAGAGLDSLAVKNRVLQIRQQADNAWPHGVGTFYGAAVSFAANGAVARHWLM